MIKIYRILTLLISILSIIVMIFIYYYPILLDEKCITGNQNNKYKNCEYHFEVDIPNEKWQIIDSSRKSIYNVEDYDDLESDFYLVFINQSLYFNENASPFVRIFIESTDNNIITIKKYVNVLFPDEILQLNEVKEMIELFDERDGIPLTITLPHVENGKIGGAVCTLIFIKENSELFIINSCMDKHLSNLSEIIIEVNQIMASIRFVDY